MCGKADRVSPEQMSTTQRHQEATGMISNLKSDGALAETVFHLISDDCSK